MLKKEFVIELVFSSNTEPTKIEQDLLKIFPKEYYYDINHLLVWHGRNLCTAKNPQCAECPVNKYCKWEKNKIVKQQFFSKLLPKLQKGTGLFAILNQNCLVLLSLVNKKLQKSPVPFCNFGRI